MPLILILLFMKINGYTFIVKWTDLSFYWSQFWNVYTQTQPASREQGQYDPDQGCVKSRDASAQNTF